MRLIAVLTLALFAGLASLAAPAYAAAIDWTKISGDDVVLFAPGQTPWEWAMSLDEMSGAQKFREGSKTCFDCHDGEEPLMGKHLVVDKPRSFTPESGAPYEKPSREPKPIAGKPGYIWATVKFAHDAEKLYVHLDVHDGDQPDAGQDTANATKITVMFSSAKAPDVSRAGCVAACHDDMTGMPSAGGAVRTHYLAGTHAKVVREGGGDTLKPDAELAKLRGSGYYLEDWQAKVNPDQPVQTAAYVVFAKRDTVSLPLTAEASVSDGVTSVTLAGTLAPGGEYLGFAPHTLYHVAFAVHEGHTAGRYHYISLEKSLTLDSGSADFVALKE